MTAVLISIPFLHAFGLFGLSLPLYVGFVTIFFKSIFLFRNLKYHLFIEDVLILLVIFSATVATLLLSSSISILNLFHFLLWSATISIFFFGTKFLISNSNFSYNSLHRAFALGLALTSIGVTMDFILKNFLGFYLSDLIPYNIDELDPTQNFSGLLYRVRGFAAEPSFTAMVYELFLPFYLINQSNTKLSKVFIIWIVACYLILTSAASIASLLVLLVILFLRSAKAFLWISITTILIYLLFFDYIEFYLNEVVTIKLFSYLSGDALRFQLVESLTPIIFENPFGLGFGTLSNAFQEKGALMGFQLIGGGALNLYLDITIAAGILGFISFCGFVAIILFRSIYYDSSKNAKALRFSCYWLLSHHFFLTEFYFPMLWVNLALIQMAYFIEQNKLR